jgi:hypothetical protein
MKEKWGVKKNQTSRYITGRKFEWKGICREICKKKACIVNDNCSVCYEISEENRHEESKHNDFESFDVEDFYNLYHSELTLKDRREKL